ncbi:MAG: hypothetical protein IJC09_06195 [Clostridia bacterium]|nr:hypothetical protein [Clostridia bacterium]
MKVNELREFYGSIGRRCRIKYPHRHYTLGLEGEYKITGIEVEKLPDERIIYRVKIKSDNECWCGYVIDYTSVELM